MFLVDTNVLSERRKNEKADPGVVSFIDTQANEIFLPVLVLGEVLTGIERLRNRGDLPQAAQLQSWYETIKVEFADRLLAFDLDCAEVWGRLMALNQQNPLDKQIAATALVYDLTVVTRNVRHYEGTGISVLNPFLADRSSIANN